MAAIAFAVFDTNVLVFTQRLAVVVENCILIEMIVHFELGACVYLLSGTVSPAKSNLDVP